MSVHDLDEARQRRDRGLDAVESRAAAFLGLARKAAEDQLLPLLDLLLPLVWVERWTRRLRLPREPRAASGSHWPARRARSTSRPLC